MEKLNLGKKTVYGPIILEKINELKRDDGSVARSAQLRQEIVTFYASGGNELQDSLDESAERDYASTRVAFVNVSSKATKKSIEAKLDEVNKLGAVLYRIVSNDVTDILSKAQIEAADTGLFDYSWEKAMERFVTKDPKSGTIILDSNGELQFKRNFFSKEFKEDVELRKTGGNKPGIETDVTSVEEFNMAEDLAADEAAKEVSLEESLA